MVRRCRGFVWLGAIALVLAACGAESATSVPSGTSSPQTVPASPTTEPLPATPPSSTTTSAAGTTTWETTTSSTAITSMTGTTSTTTATTTASTTTGASATTTFVPPPPTSMPGGPTIEIVPASGPSGTRFEARVTCSTETAPLPEGCINVTWLDAPASNAGGVKAHDYPITDGRMTLLLDSGGWLHWVKGVGEGAFYNGLGANPGTYRFTASCGCGAEAARAEALFTITHEDPVYFVRHPGMLPDVLAAPDDTRYRDLWTEPYGSGCIVDGTSLPNGVWFGLVRTATSQEVAFDLACFFVDGTAEAATAPTWALDLRGSDGDGMPVYDRTPVSVGNRNPLLFTVPTDPAATAWVAIASATTTITHIEVPLSEWPSVTSLLECPGPTCGVWLYVNGGRVTSLVEQVMSRPADDPALEGIADEIASAWPPSWTWGSGENWMCTSATIGPVGAGSVATCTPIRAPDFEDQFPVLTVLVLDDAGAIAFAQAGVLRPLNVSDAEQQYGAGSTCAELTGPRSFIARYLDDPETRYFATVLFWFLAGRPAGLDPDGDGRPCEAEFQAAAVESVWFGGGVGESP